MKCRKSAERIEAKIARRKIIQSERDGENGKKDARQAL